MTLLHKLQLKRKILYHLYLRICETSKLENCDRGVIFFGFPGWQKLKISERFVESANEIPACIPEVYNPVMTLGPLSKTGMDTRKTVIPGLNICPKIFYDNSAQMAEKKENID